MDDVRTALVGFGMAGHDIHAPLLRTTAGLVVTHVVTGNPARASVAAQELAGARVVASIEDLWVDADDLDVVILASPNQVHAEQARQAIERDVAVVVDKPLATSIGDAHTIVDLAAERGVPMTVFQNRRWDPEHLTARRLLSEGALGQVFRYEARYERWRPVPKQRWREDMTTEQGGGLLHDLQSHLVDGAMDLFGPVASVYAELAALTTAGDDVTFVVLEHVSGVRSHLGATSLAGAPGPRMRVLGRLAGYVVANVSGEASAWADWSDAGDGFRGWLARGDDRSPVLRAPGDWSAFYPAVVAMVRDGAAPPVDPRDAVRVIEVLDAARRSAREHIVVRLG